MMRRLPVALQRQGGRLLHQQCWLWGQDIRRKEGNVLIDRGFRRVRPPEGVEGSSQYTLPLCEEKHVRLWGFGIYYGAEQGVYLNRFAFRPLEVSLAGDVWTPKAFAALPVSRDFKTIAGVVRWIVAYEAGVQEELGVAYRMRCLAGWRKRALPPCEHLHAWTEFAGALTAFAEG